jgi:hypothetical protein
MKLLTSRAVLHGSSGSAPQSFDNTIVEKLATHKGLFLQTSSDHMHIVLLSALKLLSTTLVCKIEIHMRQSYYSKASPALVQE